MRQLEFSEGCRYCLNQTWLADDSGPLHPCCQYWMGELGHSSCEACRTSAALERQDEMKKEWLSKK